MSCSDTSISCSPKARIAWIRITTPATMVGARPGWRPGTLRRSSSDFPESIEYMCWIAFLVDGRQRGRRAGDRDARVDLEEVRRRQLREELLADVLRERLELRRRRRVVADVTLGVPDGPELERCMEGHLAA